MFISFEGPEGGGKTTQIELLARRLTDLGHEVVSSREPGGTPAGRALRSLLLDSEIVLTPASEALLMTADRSEHVANVIRPSLDAGKIVVTDRFLDSTIAYQGGGRGLARTLLRDMQELATGGLLPDLTFLLDLPVEVGLSRRFDGESVNRLDRETLDFHLRVRDAYHEIAALEPHRWRIIDATVDPQMVHTAIWLHVSAHLEASRTALVRGDSR